MSARRMLVALFWRDVRLAWRGGGGASLPAGFFLGCAMFAPLALGPEKTRLALLAGPLVWLFAALAALLALERLFQADLEEGGVDLFLLGPAPLELVTLTKVLALWTACGAPLALAAAPAALMLQAPLAGLGALVALLAIGLLTFLLIGAPAAALAAGVKRGGLLVALLALPSFAAPLIFGAAAGARALSGQGFWGEPTALLVGIACLAAAIGPIASAAALRLQAD